MILAQVGGDAVRACRFASQRRGNRIRFAVFAPAIARLTKRGYMVNIDAKLEHGRITGYWARGAWSCGSRRPGIMLHSSGNFKCIETILEFGQFQGVEAKGSVANHGQFVGSAQGDFGAAIDQVGPDFLQAT